MGLHLSIEAIGIKYGGGATVLKDLLAAAVPDQRFARLSVFCSPRTKRNFDIPVSDKLRVIECPFSEKNRLFRLWWLRTRFPVEVRRSSANVSLCLSGIGSTPRGIPQVSFIQQALPFYPEALSVHGVNARIRLRVILEAMKRSCRGSQVIIVQTPTMKNRVAQQFGIPADRIEVSPPAIRELPVVASPSLQLEAMRAVRPGRRLLYVGSQSPYKNLRCVIDAMTEMRRRVPGLTLFVTWHPDHPLCGGEGVVGLGYLQGAVLREAYELATALVMPSLVETVGLPMLEAMSVGTPVLAADRPYAHDVCGSAALFFDPLNSHSFAAKAISLLLNEHLRGSFVERGNTLLKTRRLQRPYERMLDTIVSAESSGKLQESQF